MLATNSVVLIRTFDPHLGAAEGSHMNNWSHLPPYSMAIRQLLAPAALLIISYHFHDRILGIVYTEKEPIKATYNFPFCKDYIV